MKIANILTFNLQSMEGVGLMEGKMGATLFYYELSRFTGIKTYNDMADNLLDEVFGSIGSVESKDIAQGLAGIGWGINYLINHSFVDTSDDPLTLLEPHLLSKGDVNFSTNFSILSPAIYLLSKPESTLTSGNYDGWVSRLLNACNYYCLSIYDNEKKSLDLINSMLYFLIELKKQEIHTWEVSKLIWKILSYLLRYEGIADNKSGDSFILLNLLKRLDDSAPLKKQVLSQLSDINSRSWNLEAYKKILWQHILYSYPIKERLTISDIERLLRSSTNNEEIKKIAVPLGLYLMNLYRLEDKNEHA